MAVANAGKVIVFCNTMYVILCNTMIKPSCSMIHRRNRQLL